jgi:hypothetical protein
LPKSRAKKKPAQTSKSVGLRLGFRSGLEERAAAQLEAAGVPFRYEHKDDRIEYVKPMKVSRYHPDFCLPNGIIVETKGRFVTADRQKHLLIRDQHPDIDIRFVFSNPKQRISKQSATTYAMWCDKHQFEYAKGSIPEDWLREARRPPTNGNTKKN